VERRAQKEGQEPCGNRSIPLPTLREARRHRALSQRGLAERAGVSPNTVRLLEAGRRGAYPSTLRKLSAALGVTPAVLAREGRPDRGEHTEE
jgi:transcriptional regulator with XRE-family HTH domain